jgi:PAS domain S-box-containing protein
MMLNNEEQIAQESVLIVEDEKIVALHIKNRLESMNYHVVGAVPTGEEAVAMAEKKRPDVILMDIMLKGRMDGIEAAEIINETNSIPIVFLTASADDKSIQRAKITEPYGYLLKPFEERDLRSTIEIALYKNKIEKKLKESELLFRSTLKCIREGIISTDENDVVKFVNNAAALLIGTPADKCVGQKLCDIYEANQDETDEILMHYSNNLTELTTEEYLNHKILKSKEGKMIPIEEEISPIINEKNEMLGKVITFRDITKRREAEMAALASRDFYLYILEKFPVPVWRTNVEGEFNYFNQTWLNFTGRQLDEEIFTGWTELIHPEDKAGFLEVFNKSVAEQKIFECEFRLLDKLGEYRWIFCVSNPFNNLNGVFSGFIGICLDITNRKLMVEELKKAKKFAESASDAKSNFLSIMSHEIRTPLNGIMGLTDLMYDTELNEEQLEYLEMLKHASQTLLELLNNLLDFSKIELGKEKLERTDFVLNDALDEIIQPYQTILRKRGINLTLDIDPLFPKELYADSRKIKQIFSNLLSNANKFTKAGSISIKILNDITFNHSLNNYKDFFAHLIVTDTGIGIPPEKQELVFESFTQVDGSSTRKYSGSGLGLTIVKKLVELMNGRIWIESEEGKGTIFHVVLELQRKNESPKKNKQSSAN